MNNKKKLELMYITNNPIVAHAAEKSGVDLIFIDLETIGKEERQGHLDTVKSQHSVDDIKKVKKSLSSAKLLVRVNPLYANTKFEVDTAINNGADYIMLPMFKTKTEVKEFIKIVDNRAKTFLLLETKEAMENIDEILSVPGIDRIHIGLNDLHLSFKKTFMFELLIDGTVEYLANKIKAKDIPFGVGGIARVGFGLVPSQYIIIEHYRIGSQFAILSRSFCDINKMENFEGVPKIFKEGISNIRHVELEASKMTDEQFSYNFETLKSKVYDVVRMKEEN